MMPRTAMLLICVVFTAALAEPDQPPASKPAMKRVAPRRAAPSRNAEEALQRVETLMDVAGQRLTDNFDAGAETQNAQAEVIEALDDAIRAANREQNAGAGKSKQQKGDSRSAGKRSQSRESSGAPKPGEQSAATDGKQPGKGGGPPPSSAPGDRAEVRRGWGFLPQRDRQAIVQGSQEEFLAKYREQIEQYYRAIAEHAEEGR